MRSGGFILFGKFSSLRASNSPQQFAQRRVRDGQNDEMVVPNREQFEEETREVSQ
jgi:hypothetical protein